MRTESAQNLTIADSGTPTLAMDRVAGAGRMELSSKLARLGWALGLVLGGVVAAEAAGGTAGPPAPGLGTQSFLSTLPPPVPPPVFTAPLSDIKGFSIVGFLQKATVSGENCQPGTPPEQFGGTVVVNDTAIVVPCNTTLQMPAATYRWAELFDPQKVQPANGTLAALSLDEIEAQTSGGSGSPGGPGATAGSGSQGGAGFSLASIEVTIVGNLVADRFIAGLMYVSQQSLNTSNGFIVGFDYDKGVVLVGKSRGGGAVTRLQLNDANGRFSKGQSPDARFNVDDVNPTIHATTGYPMCVPRKNPSDEDDPKCPQRNRPLVAAGCRNFAAAGIALPTGREMAPPVQGQIYCSNFVMPNPALAGPQDPISTEQAPLQIGDYITYSGTLLVGDKQGPGGSETISVHTLDAAVGIYTQPGTLPVYLVMGEARISAEAPLNFNGVPQEAPDRLVLDAFVTDVTSIVDIYLVDIDPADGHETQRWVTPQSMTGGIGAFGTNDLFIDGGITTQLSGPVPGRVRIRANKATPGLLTSPTRYIRVVARSLCDPVNVNAPALLVGSNPPTNVPCLKRAPAANGLYSGQYLAPMFNFLFPENIVAGDNIVPNNLWALGFLVNGEGPGTGPLSPTPW